MAGELLRSASRLLSNVRKRWSSSAAKRSIWDREFAEGRWDYLDHSRSDIVYRYIEKYTRGGDILDLGCGAGATANELDERAYRHYVGVDISQTAVSKAIARSERNGRGDKHTFLAGDYASSAPEGSYQVVLFRESLYFVPAYGIRRLLADLAGRLAPTGVFIVRMYDRAKFASIVRVIEDEFRVMERYLASEAGTILLVFTPRT